MKMSPILPQKVKISEPFFWSKIKKSLFQSINAYFFSFWEVDDGYMCGGLPPNVNTTTIGWKHVTAGGKETCHGDYGAPLICDIDGTATLIGVHSIGDLTECGLDGRPAIHTEVQEVKHWMDYIIDAHGPPTKCFEFIVDMNVEGALGDQIEVYHTYGDEEEKKLINAALKAQQKRNEICVVHTQEGDKFRFKSTGKDNVSQFKGRNRFHSDSLK